MGLIVTILIPIILMIIILLIVYLRMIYECLRKVKILKSINGNNNNNRSIEEKNIINGNYIIEKYSQAPGPLPWPIIGNLTLLAKYEAPFQGFSDLAKKFGDVYTLTLGTTRCLVVNNLDLIREVLNQNGKYFGGRPDFIRYHRLFGGDRNNSLALCDWSALQQKRRNLARKHCSPRDASTFFEKMNNVGCFEMQELMEKLSNDITPGKEFHLKPLIMQTCANMFTQYMCTTRFNYDDKEFQMIVHYFDEIFWEINQGYAIDFLPWLLPFYTSHMNKLVKWATVIRKFILDKIINEHEETLDDETERDLTDALLKNLNKENDFSRERLMFMLEDFIGGHSAIGNLVMIALAHIVRNPIIGKKIQNEIDNITGETKRIISLYDMENMPYTVGTIYEVLRHSSSPIVPHVATEDAQISGYGVTKGTIVFINNYELNTSTKYWDNPEIFDPERFLEKVKLQNYNNNSNKTTITRRISNTSDDSGVEIDNEKLQQQKESEEVAVEVKRLKKNIPHFLPFSIGKRTCIGKNLARGFGFLILANILQTYDVYCADVNKVKTFPSCVALPPETFPLILRPRSS